MPRKVQQKNEFLKIKHMITEIIKNRGLKTWGNLTEYRIWDSGGKFETRGLPLD